MRWTWDRWAGLAGIAYVILYIAAFALGIEVGASDREILEYYGDSGHRAKEVAAFFVIAAAALAFLLFASRLRQLLRPSGDTLAAIGWAGAVTYAALTLAGNAVSRATAFAAMETDTFELEPNTRRVLEAAGFLLLVSGALAAMLLVVTVSVAAVRARILPRWLGWAGFVAAALLPLAIGFIGFLVLFLWVLATSIVLVARRSSAIPEAEHRP